MLFLILEDEVLTSLILLGGPTYVSMESDTLAVSEETRSCLRDPAPFREPELGHTGLFVPVMPPRDANLICQKFLFYCALNDFLR